MKESSKENLGLNRKATFSVLLSRKKWMKAINGNKHEKILNTQYSVFHQNKKRNVPQKHIPFFVHPMGIEPISSEPESGILSIELRVHPIFRVQKYK